MARLYEIDAAIERFEFTIDEATGEITNYDELAALQMERTAKIENICLYVKNLRSDALAIRAEEKSLAERRKSIESRAERLESFIERQLCGEKFSTAKTAVSYRKSKVCEIDSIAEIKAYDASLIRVSYEADKTAIKERLISGQTVPGAKLVDNITMTIK